MDNTEKSADPVKRPETVPAAAAGDTPALSGFVGLLAGVLLIATDYLLHPRVSFAPAYLLVVLVVAWADGTTAGVFVGLITSVAVGFEAINHNATVGTIVWNVAGQMVVSICAVLFAGRGHDVIRRLEKNVANQKFVLQDQVDEHLRTEEQLRKTMQQLRQLAENIADAFWIRDPQSGRIVYVSPAYEKIWGRDCKDLYQSPDAGLEAVHPEDRPQIAIAMARQPLGEYQEKYRIVRPDGAMRWIRDRAFPIRDSSGRLLRIVGIAEDITEQHQLERQILEISDAERVRIGQDLHDSLCQKLISIAFDNHSLEQKLAGKASPDTGTVHQIGEILDDAITEARAISRGLFPVQMEADGLRAALERLASDTASRSKVECRLECPGPVQVSDNIVATHLYRIAQEAVTNALKHGRVGAIVIRLAAANHRIELAVSDNGAGMSAPRKAAGGMGLHIMNYRARTIGGVLEINRSPEGGTVVACSAPDRPV